MNDTKISFIINSTVANQFKQLGCLHIHTTVNWDDFERIANTFASVIGATIKNKDIGADLHRWQLDFDGVRLYLFIEENSESLWLELDQKEDQDTLDYIENLLEKYHDKYTTNQ